MQLQIRHILNKGWSLVSSVLPSFAPAQPSTLPMQGRHSTHSVPSEGHAALCGNWQHELAERLLHEAASLRATLLVRRWRASYGRVWTAGLTEVAAKQVTLECISDPIPAFIAGGVDKRVNWVDCTGASLCTGPGRPIRPVRMHRSSAACTEKGA